MTLAPTTAAYDWREEAVCAQRGFTPDDFMPTSTHGRYRNDVKAACADCPVREQCLQTALESPWPPYGLWAGLASRDLERLWAFHHPNYRTRMAELGIPTLDSGQEEDIA